MSQEQDKKKPKVAMPLLSVTTGISVVVICDGFRIVVAEVTKELMRSYLKQLKKSIEKQKNETKRRDRSR